jgi:chromosome segregation ATPase
MTTPRDAIGLSERLRRQGAGEDGYRTVFNGTLLEAATALDALQAENEQFRRVAIDRLDKLTKAEARVKELEADYLAVSKWHTEAAEENDELQARATSAEQERDGLEAQLDALSASHRDLASRLAAMGRERDEAYERAAQCAECIADEYDATSFTSVVAGQVAALRSKEQAAHEIAAAIRRLAAGTEKEEEPNG